MKLTVAPRSLPLVLYPPRHMSVLEISASAFPGQVFRLWMPELIVCDDGHDAYNQANTGAQHWTTHDGGALLRCHACRTDLLSVASRVRIGDGHLELQYELENRSPAALTKVVVGTCYQLAAAPDFRDQAGGRTYAWADERLANIARDGVTAECHDHHHRSRNSFLSMPDAGRGPGIMAVEARSGGATAMAWQSHDEYSGNTDPALCCIHAGPVVAALAPGARVGLHGWLGWSRQPVAELCERARRRVARAI